MSWKLRRGAGGSPTQGRRKYEYHCQRLFGLHKRINAALAVAAAAPSCIVTVTVGPVSPDSPVWHPTGITVDTVSLKPVGTYRLLYRFPTQRGDSSRTSRCYWPPSPVIALRSATDLSTSVSLVYHRQAPSLEAPAAHATPFTRRPLLPGPVPWPGVQVSSPAPARLLS